jgi:hypothetical protein
VLSIRRRVLSWNVFRCFQWNLTAVSSQTGAERIWLYFVLVKCRQTHSHLAQIDLNDFLISSCS